MDANSEELPLKRFKPELSDVVKRGCHPDSIIELRYKSFASFSEIGLPCFALLACICLIIAPSTLCKALSEEGSRTLLPALALIFAFRA